MGSGFALDSYKGMRFLLSQKGMRRARYNEMKEAVSDIKSKYHPFIDRNTLSPEELNKYKQKIKRKITFDRQKSFIISLFVTAFIGAGIYFIVRYAYHYYTNQ